MFCSDSYTFGTKHNVMIYLKCRLDVSGVPGGVTIIVFVWLRRLNHVTAVVSCGVADSDGKIGCVKGRCGAG